MKNKLKKGFTLVEMLVVVAIIGVLSTVLYTSYNRYIKSTKETVAKSEVLTIVQCFETAMLDNIKNKKPTDEVVTAETFTSYDELLNLDLEITYNTISDYILPEHIILDFDDEKNLKYVNTKDSVEVIYNYNTREFVSCTTK